MELLRPISGRNKLFGRIVAMRCEGFACAGRHRDQRPDDRFDHHERRRP